MVVKNPSILCLPMATSHESPLAHERDYVMITQDPLSIEAATKEVQSDEVNFK